MRCQSEALAHHASTLAAARRAVNRKSRGAGDKRRKRARLILGRDHCRSRPRPAERSRALTLSAGASAPPFLLLIEATPCPMGGACGSLNVGEIVGREWIVANSSIRSIGGGGGIPRISSSASSGVISLTSWRNWCTRLGRAALRASQHVHLLFPPGMRVRCANPAGSLTQHQHNHRLSAAALNSSRNRNFVHMKGELSGGPCSRASPIPSVRASSPAWRGPAVAGAGEGACRPGARCDAHSGDAGSNDDTRNGGKPLHFLLKIASVMAPLRPSSWQVLARRERAAAGRGA